MSKEKGIFAKNSKELNLIKSIVYHPLFATFLAVVGMIAYFADIQLVGLAIYAFVASVVFLSLRDVSPIIPILLLVTFMFRNLDFGYSAWFYVIIVPVALSFIAHFFLFKPDQFRMGRVFIPIVCVSIAMFLGGIFSFHMNDYAKGLTNILTLGPLVLFIYWFFIQYTCPPKDFDFKSWFFNILFVTGIVMTVEITFWYLNFKVLKTDIFTTSNMGWGSTNTVGLMLIVSTPACFYRMLKQQQITFNLFFALLFTFATYLSGSDACFAILCVFDCIMAVFVYAKLRSTKLKYVLLTEICALGIIALVYLLIDGDMTAKIIEALKKNLSGDSGRTPLYQEAWSLFLDSPIFGASLGYYNDALYNNANAIVYTYFFHSTFFQIIASMGIMGLIAYVYYFVQRYRVLTCKFCAFNLFAYVSFSLFEIYGFVDVCEFSIIPNMIFATLIIVAVEYTNEKDNAKPLPLINQYIDISKSIFLNR